MTSQAVAITALLEITRHYAPFMQLFPAIADKTRLNALLREWVFLIDSSQRLLQTVARSLVALINNYHDHMHREIHPESG